MPNFELSNGDATILSTVIGHSDFRTQQEVLDYLIKNYAYELIKYPLAIDTQPADNGAYKTQEQWIISYNGQEGEFKGKRMISSPDILGAPEHASAEELASLQEDCRDSWIVTGTHNSYHPNTLAGKVIHNYLSAVVRPKVVSLDDIPVLQGVPLTEVVKMQSGLLYVRALADDEHAKSVDLSKNLVELTGREPQDILFYTPTQSSRNSYPERAVGFGDVGGRFRVSGLRFDDGSGLSRGVLIIPRSGRAKK